MPKVSQLFKNPIDLHAFLTFPYNFSQENYVADFVKTTFLLKAIDRLISLIFPDFVGHIVFRIVGI